MADSTPTDDLFASASILPSDPIDDGGAPLDVIHDREYRVRAFRLRNDVMLIRGAVRDQKPPGLFVDADPSPLTMHHMQIDLEIGYPTMEILRAKVGIEIHPNDACPSIEGRYDQLVGLTISRGFTHRVRELFGGPRGCTHTTALLQAMAPVAIQCTGSMRNSAAISDASATGGTAGLGPSPEQDGVWRMNVNTCHVWAEDGERVALFEAGGDGQLPIPVRERMVELGLKPGDWPRRTTG